jgi:hypothetical protein
MAARAAVPRSASTAVGEHGGSHLPGGREHRRRAGRILGADRPRAGGLTHDESFFLLLNVDEDQAAGMGHGGRGVAAGQLMLAG